MRVVDELCTVSLPAALLGERWTLQLLRQAFLGTRRFEDFQSALDISRSVLTDRLGTLVEAGVLRREAYKDVRTRYEYRLTEKGLDLYPVLVSLMAWGNRYGGFEDGPPVQLEHKLCGHHTTPKLVCSECGEELRAREVIAHEAVPAA